MRIILILKFTSRGKLSWLPQGVPQKLGLLHSQPWTLSFYTGIYSILFWKKCWQCWVHTKDLTHVNFFFHLNRNKRCTYYSFMSWNLGVKINYMIKKTHIFSFFLHRTILTRPRSFFPKSYSSFKKKKNLIKQKRTNSWIHLHKKEDESSSIPVPAVSRPGRANETKKPKT